ncbi:MAG: VOC family protein [Phycisphaerales bacterium]|nr:VOC family protein [Phycisphaerales bacterium]
MQIEHISAVTFFVQDMSRSVRFYEKCGFRLIFGGPEQEFTSLQAGRAYVNLIHRSDYDVRWWGRAIFRVDEVDEHYRMICAAGLSPEAQPQNATWGERYYHLTDPDGHELSFAELL